MPRIQGLTEKHLTENELLKTGEGYVFSITIAFIGVTAGQFCLLRDGTTGSANPLAVFAFPTTNGTITKEWSQGKKFETGLFYDEGATAGQVEVELTYK